MKTGIELLFLIYHIHHRASFVSTHTNTHNHTEWTVDTTAVTYAIKNDRYIHKFVRQLILHKINVYETWNGDGDGDGSIVKMKWKLKLFLFMVLFFLHTSFTLKIMQKKSKDNCMNVFRRTSFREKKNTKFNFGCARALVLALTLMLAFAKINCIGQKQ